MKLLALVPYVPRKYGFGGSDLEPLGLPKGREGTGLCWIQGGGYKWGYRHPDRPSDFPRNTRQPEPRSVQHRGLCSAWESFVFLEDSSPSPQFSASLAVVNGQ